MRRLPSFLFSTALLITALTLGGCLKGVAVERIEWNDRIRLDREPLTPEQREVVLDRGTFSDGKDAAGRDSALVSEIHPASLPGRAATNLPLADCLWIGVGPNGREGDRIALSWQGVLFLDPEAEIEPNPVEMCRATDPYGGGPSGYAQTGSGLNGSFKGFAISTDPDRAPLDHDATVMGAGLIATQRAAADPDNRCPSAPMSGAEVHLPRQDSFICLKDELGSTSFCGARCGYRPTADASYRLVVDPTVGFDWEERQMSPDVLVVRGERRLVRPLARLAGNPPRFRWSTPTVAGPDAAGKRRWRENFSSHVLVDRVRVLRRDATGETGLSNIDDDRLRLRGVDAGSQTVIWDCSGTPSSEGTVFDLVNCRQGAQDVDLKATPTYAVDHLSPRYGEPLSEPLEWEVAFLEDPLAAGGELFLEFIVQSEAGPAALRMSDAALGFGRKQIGTRGEAATTAVNVGGQTLRVERVWIDGPQAGDFSFRLPAEPVPVPLPLELRHELEIETARYSLAESADAEELGLMISWHDEEQGLSTWRPATAPEPRRVWAYGAWLEIDGERLYRDLEKERYVFEPATPEVSRPFVRAVHARRSLPFELVPGDAFEIAVEASPSAYGDRDAQLWVEASPVSAPSEKIRVATALHVHGIYGPTLGWAPRRLVFSSTGAPDRQAMLIENHGQLDMTRTSITLGGPDAARFQVLSQHPPSRLLVPGSSEIFRLEYLPDCDSASHQATLEIVTNGGTATVELLGGSFCE